MEKVKCSKCGFDKYKGVLHVHHIDHNHENNQSENLMVLCANCHMEYHHVNGSNHKGRKPKPPVTNIEDMALEELRKTKIKLISKSAKVKELEREIALFENTITENKKIFNRFVEELAMSMGGDYYQNIKNIYNLQTKIYIETRIPSTLDPRLKSEMEAVNRLTQGWGL